MVLSVSVQLLFNYCSCFSEKIRINSKEQKLVQSSATANLLFILLESYCFFSSWSLNELYESHP